MNWPGNKILREMLAQERATGEKRIREKDELIRRLWELVDRKAESVPLKKASEMIKEPFREPTDPVSTDYQTELNQIQEKYEKEEAVNGVPV